jgi:hypothetical protein
MTCHNRLTLCLAICLLAAPLVACSGSSDNTAGATEAGPSGPQEEVDTSEPGPAGAAQVKLVYFHRKNRCYSCIYVEEGARYVVNEYFADELANGTLAFDVYTVEDNPELAEQYRAFSSSLYVNRIDEDGTEHIEEVEDIWLHIGDDQAFVEAVRRAVEAALYGES